MEIQQKSTIRLNGIPPTDFCEGSLLDTREKGFNDSDKEGGHGILMTQVSKNNM